MVRAYLEQVESRMPKHTRLRDIPFAVIDTEATGLDAGRSGILTIGGYRLKGMEIDLSTSLHAVINREDYQPGSDIRVHGIMSRHVQSGIPEKEALERLLAFVGGRIIVGHHIAFDIRLINRALRNTFGIRLGNRTLDTGQLASRVEKPVLDRADPESLDALCSRYRIPPLARHTAAGDAYVTALLFLKLLGRLEKRGVDTWRKLLR